MKKSCNDEVLAKMTNLKSLYLYKCKISTFAHLTNLQGLTLLSNYPETNIEKLYNLERLYLRDTTNFANLNHLSKLTELSVDKTSTIFDDNLEKITTLKSLKILASACRNLSPRLANLQTIIVWTVTGENTDKLSYLTNLRYLSFFTYQNNFTITNLTKLEHLSISIGGDNSEVDFRNLDNLTELISDYNHLKFDNISHLTKLEVLSVQEVDGLNKISLLTNLKYLNNAGGNIENDEILALTNLVELDVTANKYITNLNNLNKLRILALGEQKLSHEGFRNLTDLVELALYNNPIEDLNSYKNLRILKILKHCYFYNENKNKHLKSGSISSLTNLHTLHIKFNEISIIKDLTNLTFLDICECPIRNDQLKNLTKLKCLQMSRNNYITDINHLINLTRLEVGGNVLLNYEGFKELSNLEELHIQRRLNSEQLKKFKHLRED